MKIDTRAEDTAFIPIGALDLDLLQTMVDAEPKSKRAFFTSLVTLNNLLEPMGLVVDFKPLEERCILCNQLISIENEKLPLDEGVCYHCMFGPTGDPEDTEER